MSPFSFTPRLPRGWPCNTAPALYPLRPSEGLCACAAPVAVERQQLESG